ncbi:hypothetical protein GGR52DRAFT_44318 [Hypoxylon sp. FL1284]|nr:hypothetical protein GGR52DRAFT_44318 [Hypoxylon sp. FL1284]
MRTLESPPTTHPTPAPPTNNRAPQGIALLRCATAGESTVAEWLAAAPETAIRPRQGCPTYLGLSQSGRKADRRSSLEEGTSGKMMREDATNNLTVFFLTALSPAGGVVLQGEGEGKKHIDPSRQKRKEVIPTRTYIVACRRASRPLATVVLSGYVKSLTATLVQIRRSTHTAYDTNPSYLTVLPRFCLSFSRITNLAYLYLAPAWVRRCARC